MGAIAAATFLIGATGGRAAAPFAIAKAPYAFSFPADHGAHPLYQSEWWYFTGNLRTKSGHRFGYELTFFRIRLRPEDAAPAPVASARSRWRGDQVYAAHFAITDETGQKFTHSERVARPAFGLGAAAKGRLAVRADDWSLLGQALADQRGEGMTLHAAAAQNGLDLVQTPRKPPVVHGQAGVFRKGACASCASHYYSYTRLSTRGTLRYAGSTFNVDGTSWMDHEFGTNQLQPDEVGWDWISLQLDDGREVMLYIFRRKDGSFAAQSAGSLIERDARVRFLPLGAFHVTATGRWQSPQTHADYPSGWRVQIPAARLDVTLAPVVSNQEIALESAPSYWEGAVDVRDTSAPGRTRGQGYVELTGYAEPVEL
jgi:predicted secreted hydrolase